nr:hypothetical protein [Tanacetum cinerariifolium]
MNEQKLHHLEEALPEAPPATGNVVVRNTYIRRVTKQQEVACLMLQADQELFKTVKVFHSCKQEEGQSVSTYVLKMKAYLDQMERLGCPMPLVLGVNLILTLVSKDYDQFMQNYNMHGMGKTIHELHAMLKLTEKSIPKKASVVLAIRHKIPSPAKKEHPAKDTECYHYYKTGHKKRNYPLYLAELKKNKAITSGTSAEYIAAMEAIWIRKFISGLGVIPSIDEPMDMYCENIRAITIAEEPGVQNGAKHF